MVLSTRIELVMAGYQPTVIPFNYKRILVEAVRFELTDPFEPSVFKTGAINRTLPHFHNLVPKVGLEPTRFSF